VELVDFAVDGCRRMRDLIDSLLAHARAGSAGDPPTVVDLARVVGEVERDLGATITARGAIVSHGDLPEVLASADELRQVLANLISNAVKFVPPGDVPRVRVGSTRGVGEWIVTVDDNGVGIDPEFRDRVFGAFERLHVREAYPGTGIGLAICRRIVERRGGRIWSDIGPDGGTRFAFTIPDPPG
jgi:signal transduction histidine kinase